LGRWESFLKVRGWRSEFRSVDRYLRHYERMVGSLRTRRNCLVALGMLCGFAGLKPDELVKLSQAEASELVQGFLDSKRRGGRSVRYLNVLHAYLKTFFRVNGFKGERELDVERFYQPARYRKRGEYVPTPEEIYKMAYAAGSKRNRAIILTLYTSGLRVSTLRALRVRDVKEELDMDLHAVMVPVYPDMKEVDPGACKGGIPYYTFISSEAAEALREYLAERRHLHLDQPLFCSETTNIPEERRTWIPVKVITVQQVVKRAARRAGIREWRHVTPHCLRKAFESALRNSGMDVDDREFLIGHILPGTRDPYYDKDKIERLRMKYAAVRFFGGGEVDKVEMIKAFAKTLGIERIEIKVTQLMRRNPNLNEMDALGQVIREELIKRVEVKEGKTAERADPKRIVDETELEKYLADGWDVQTILPSGRILIKKAPV